MWPGYPRGSGAAKPADLPQRPQVGFTNSVIDAHELRLSLDAHFIQHPAATFFFVAEGDAMRDAGLQSGDILLVDRARTPTVGKVVVACVEGELVVRRLARISGRYYLTADNPAYPPLPLAEDLDHVVWGVVASWHHDETGEPR
ncbi:MAG TPA: S24 family peptidase [Rhodothermales bacterium]|nr:S24 family peptidase [Rhodothermales bacterium]